MLIKLGSLPSIDEWQLEVSRVAVLFGLMPQGLKRPCVGEQEMSAKRFMKTYLVCCPSSMKRLELLLFMHIEPERTCS